MAQISRVCLSGTYLELCKGNRKSEMQITRVMTVAASLDRLRRLNSKDGRFSQSDFRAASSNRVPFSFWCAYAMAGELNDIHLAKWSRYSSSWRTVVQAGQFVGEEPIVSGKGKARSK
jgi:hypothetical protein